MSPTAATAWLSFDLLLAGQLAIGLIAARWLVVQRWLPQKFLLLGSIAVICIIGLISYFFHLFDYQAARWLSWFIITWGVLALILIFRQIKLLWAERQLWLYPLSIMVLLSVGYSVIAGSCTYHTLIWGEQPVMKACVVKMFPEDNYLPFMFSSRIVNGEKGKAVGGWTQTDRPPLEVGVMLSEVDGVIGDYRNSYQAQAMGVFLQLSWVAAIWGIALYSGLSQRVRNITLAALTVSGFTYFNSIYVWSKLLAGAFVAAGAILLLYERRPGIFPDRKELMSGAVFVTLGLLSHEGVIFTIIPLGLWLLWRVIKRVKKPNMRWSNIIWAAIAGVVLYLPWLIFKTHDAPPGDHLTKLQLAGDITINNTSTLQAIISAYSHLGFTTWLSYRWDNILTIIGDPVALRGISLATIQLHLRELDFFSIVFALGFINLGLIRLFFRRDQLGQAERIMIRLILASLAIWIIILFSPYSTTIHQGSYTVMLYLFLLGGIGMSLMRRPVRYSILAAQAVYMSVIWIQPYLH